MGMGPEHLLLPIHVPGASSHSDVVAFQSERVDEPVHDDLGYHIDVPGCDTELCGYPRVPIFPRRRKSWILSGRPLSLLFLVPDRSIATSYYIFLCLRDVLGDYERAAGVCDQSHERCCGPCWLAMGMCIDLTTKCDTDGL